jgi:ABC-type transport system involved in cytochrome bd biosynthesis fused ATPase/permease subunit
MNFGILGLTLYAVVIGINLFFRRETVRFLAKNAAIADLTGLEAFKNLARRNMRAVFPLLVLIILGMVLIAQLVIHDPLFGFVTFLLVNVLLVWSALALRKVETLARALTCRDPALVSEYQRVANSWLCDPWPNF